MRTLMNDGFADRQKASNAAKLALLQKMRPQAYVAAPDFVSRSTRKASELEEVRRVRTDAKEQLREARASELAAKLEAEAQAEEAALAAVRSARKERKQLSQAEAKAKRDARYAARKARK